MKKRVVWAFMILVLAAALFAGCKNNKEAKNVDLDAMGNKLLKEISWKDTMEPVDEAALYKIYTVKEEDVVKGAAYQSTGATAEEIALWECKDADAAKRVYEAMVERISDQKESFTDYNPEELDKLKSPVLVKSGNYVFLCLSDNNDKAKELIGE